MQKAIDALILRHNNMRLPPSVGRLKPTADARNVVGPTWVRLTGVSRSFAPNKRHNNSENSGSCEELAFIDVKLRCPQLQLPLSAP